MRSLLKKNRKKYILMSFLTAKFNFQRTCVPSFSSLRIGILLLKLFSPYHVRKNSSSNEEKLLKFKAEGREFAKKLRSLEQSVRKF